MFLLDGRRKMTEFHQIAVFSRVDGDSKLSVWVFAAAPCRQVRNHKPRLALLVKCVRLESRYQEQRVLFQ